MFQESFLPLIQAIESATRSAYGERLVALAVFGSVARGTARPDSDVDLFIVARGLPRGRLARAREFDAVEEQLQLALEQARTRGLHTRLSPIFKTPDELAFGSPLLFDMTDRVGILCDPEGLLRERLAALKDRFAVLGSKRVQRAGGYYWVLKPDYRAGDIIEV